MTNELYFKDIITHNRVVLMAYDKEHKIVIIKDLSDNLNKVISLDKFHKNYEYMWMSH